MTWKEKLRESVERANRGGERTATVKVKLPVLDPVPTLTREELDELSRVMSSQVTVTQTGGLVIWSLG
jgi:hypothetical protein